MKIFGREPALWIGLIQGLLLLLVGVGLDWTGDQVTWVMAAVVAGFACVTAWLTQQWQMSLLVGLITSVFAMLVGFGWEPQPDLQAAVIGAAVAVASFFTRTQTSPSQTALTEGVPANA